MQKTILKPKLGFRNATVAEQIGTASRLARGVASLPPELRDRVPLAQLQEILNEAILVDQLLEKYRARAKTLLVRQKAVMPKLRMMARCCTSGVESLQILAGDSVVLKVGLDLEKSKRVRTGAPPVPTALRAKIRAGAVTVLWKNAMRRSIFNVEYAIDSPDSGWRQDGSSFTVPQARFTFKPAVPGTFYWFRVQAWNSNGQSEWSAPLSVRAV